MNTMLKKRTKQSLQILMLICFLGSAVNGFAGDFKNGPYDHRIFSINMGYSFSGRGDCWGMGNEISHLKTFLPGVFHRESISSWLINGKSWVGTGYDHQSGFDYSMEIGYSPLLRKSKLFSITGGGCISYKTIFYPGGGGGMWQLGNSYMTQTNYSTESRIDTGFTLGLNYHTMVNSKIWLNMRAAFKAYKYGNISIFSVGIGYNPPNKMTGYEK